MKTLYNTLLIGSLILCAVELSFAHPRDSHDNTNPAQFGQHPYAALGLDDPEIFEIHRQYWHHRRSMFQKINQYHQCRGQLSLLAVQQGLPDTYFDPWLEPQTLDYIAAIPAHPCIDAAHNGISGYSQRDYCLGQLDAAIFTDNYMSALVPACFAAVEFVRSVFGK